MQVNQQVLEIGIELKKKCDTFILPDACLHPEIITQHLTVKVNFTKNNRSLILSYNLIVSINKLSIILSNLTILYRRFLFKELKILAVAWLQILIIIETRKCPCLSNLLALSTFLNLVCLIIHQT